MNFTFCRIKALCISFHIISFAQEHKYTLIYTHTETPTRKKNSHLSGTLPNYKFMEWVPVFLFLSFPLLAFVHCRQRMKKKIYAPHATTWAPEKKTEKSSKNSNRVDMLFSCHFRRIPRDVRCRCLVVVLALADFQHVNSHFLNILQVHTDTPTV